MGYFAVTILGIIAGVQRYPLTVAPAGAFTPTYIPLQSSIYAPQLLVGVIHSVGLAAEIEMEKHCACGCPSGTVTESGHSHKRNRGSCHGEHRNFHQLLSTMKSCPRHRWYRCSKQSRPQGLVAIGEIGVEPYHEFLGFWYRCRHGEDFH